MKTNWLTTAATFCGLLASASPSQAQVAATATVEVAQEKATDAKKEEPDDDAKPSPDAKSDVDVVVEAVVAAPAAGAEGGDQWDMMEKQFVQQFRPMLQGQLHFVRTVCRPTNEEFKALKEDGEKTLQAAAKKCVDMQKKMQQGGFQFGRDSQPDPNKDIGLGIVESVKKRLSAEQASRFQKQFDERTASRKRVAIMNLVAKMDRDLLLSSQQREQLTKVLSENWKERWGTSLIYYIQNDAQQYPPLPDEKIVPLLTEQQAIAWKAIPRQEIHYWGFGAFLGMMGAIELEEGIGIVGEAVFQVQEVEPIPQDPDGPAVLPKEERKAAPAAEKPQEAKP